MSEEIAFKGTIVDANWRKTGETGLNARIHVDPDDEETFLRHYRPVKGGHIEGVRVAVVLLRE